MPQIRVAMPRRSGRPSRNRRGFTTEALTARGFHVTEFEDGPWRPDLGDIVLIRGNASWYPKLTRELLASEPDRLPKLIIWHIEPLPPPRASGLPWPWLDHREIAKIVLRDPRATDPYSNYFILRRLHKRGLPHRLLMSTVERVEFLRERGIESHHVPMGYAPDQGRDLGITRDIDVLFLGASSLRRSLKLAYLRRHGIAATALGDWHNPALFGEDRTRLINRAKIFLNIPRFVGQFALARFTLGSANKALLLSEPLYNSAPFVPGEHYVAAEYKDMPDVIDYYLKHEEERKRIADQGYRLTMQKCLMADSFNRLALHIEQLSEGNCIEDPDSGT